MNFEQDWFMRQLEAMAEGAARKIFNKAPIQEVRDLREFGGDDPVWCQLCALLSKLEFCAAEDLLWEHLRPGDPACFPLAEAFYRELGGFGEDTLQAHDFSRRDVREGLERAREYIENQEAIS